ncbi:hypothetical protein Tco_0885522 [Tanacetum coccineum]
MLVPHRMNEGKIRDESYYINNSLCKSGKENQNQKHETLHDCTAMSSTEAEYVALSTSYAQVENGIIELYFVKTEYQLADMFTKALPKDRFQYLVRRIGMRCLTPAELEVLANESS